MADVAFFVVCHPNTMLATDPKPVAWWAVSSEDAVNGNGFVKRVSELAVKRGVPVRLDYRRGKGSHATLYFGARKTVVKGRC